MSAEHWAQEQGCKGGSHGVPALGRQPHFAGESQLLAQTASGVCEEGCRREGTEVPPRLGSYPVPGVHLFPTIMVLPPRVGGKITHVL